MEKTNKLGIYITKLMTTVLDNEAEQFVRELAMSELRRINIDINDFLRKNVAEDDTEKPDKQLLQEQENEQLNLFEEEKKDGKKWWTIKCKRWKDS